MHKPFRKSKFIDFNKGHVFIAPMDFMNNIQRPWDLRQKIEVFECRVEVWQLGVAAQILKEMENPDRLSTSIWSHAAYGLIAVIFSYFEMIGKTLNPQSRCRDTARPDFNYGFCDVYQQYKPQNDNYSDANLPEVREFRDRIRNGMYHLAYTKSRLWIHHDLSISTNDFDTKDPSEIGLPGTETVYLMDPHLVTRTIVNHFPNFIGRLKNSDSKFNGIRTKFKEFFDEFHRD